MKRIKCELIKSPPPQHFPPEHVLETTLAIIKPDGMVYRNEILKLILKAGFQIIQRKMVRLSPEQASDFYKNKHDLKAYNLMVFSLSEGPIEVMCLAKEDAIEAWKCLMGPERKTDAILCFPDTIRGRFSTCTDDERNVVHGSENERCARFEIHFFFPNFIIEPIRQEDAYKLCCESVLMSTLFDGLYKVSVERPFDPVTWLAQWLLQHNPLKPVVSDTCDSMKEKISELEKIAAATGTKISTAKYKGYSHASTSSLSSSAISCICSCEPCSTTSGKSERSVHAQACSCSLVLNPKDVTFCPVCHKTMKFQLRQSCDESAVSSSSHVVSAPTSSNVETQTESSTSICSYPKVAEL